MGLNSVEGAFLNGDDFASMEFEGDTSFVEGNVTTYGINGDLSLCRVFWDGLTRSHTQEYHAIAGLIDQYLGIKLAIKFNEVIEVVRSHSSILFLCIWEALSTESYAAHTKCAMT